LAKLDLDLPQTTARKKADSDMRKYDAPRPGAYAMFHKA
jgi:hypothetical protein